MEHRLILGGEQYLPFARSCVVKLKKLGLPYANQSFEVDGVSIKVRIEPGHEYIRIEGGVGYVESGVLNLHDIQLGVRETYTPATIKLTPFVSTLMAKPTSLPNAGSRKVKDGDDSWSAAGCKSKVDVVDTIIGTDTEIHFESDPPAFCDPDRMKMAKRLYEYVPSSTYTGKLKLFVQALYGSKRTDYRSAGFMGQYIEVSTGKFTVPPEGSIYPPREIFASLTNGYPTHGLLTVPAKTKPKVATNEYVLVGIGIDAVTYRKMKKPGVLPQTKTHDHDDLLEVFRLATLVPDVESVAATGPDMSAFTAGWERLAHGWHFNKAGTEASIVLMRAKTIEGISFHFSNPATIGGYEFVQYTMNLNWAYAADDKPASLSYSISEIARGDHIPYLQTKVFYPDLFANILVLLTPQGGGTIGSWDCWANLTAPLYCYYDKDDKLVTVMVNNTAPVDRPAVKTPNDGMEEITGSNIVVGGTWEMVDLPVSKFAASNGVTFGEASYMGEHTQYYTPTFRTVMHMTITPNINGGSITPDGGSYMRTVRKDNESTRSTAFCVIPFGDASSVIAGLEKSTTGVFNYSIYKTFGNYASVMNQFSIPPYSEPALWTQYQMLWLTEADGGVGAIPSPGSTSSTVLLHTDTGATVVLSTFSVTWNLGAAEPIPPYAGLFHPAGIAAPYYAYPMTVRTSYFGAALQHLFCEPVLNPDKPEVSLFGWPDARWSAAVGWA